jgi:hypothetical protein
MEKVKCVKIESERFFNIFPVGDWEEMERSIMEAPFQSPQGTVGQGTEVGPAVHAGPWEHQCGIRIMMDHYPVISREVVYLPENDPRFEDFGGFTEMK